MTTPFKGAQGALSEGAFNAELSPNFISPPHLAQHQSSIPGAARETSLADGIDGRPSMKRRRLEEAFSRKAQAEQIMKRVRAQQRRVAPLEGASDDEEHFAKRETARMQRDIAKLNPITLRPPITATTAAPTAAGAASTDAGGAHERERPTVVQNIYIKAPKGTAKTAAPHIEVAAHTSAIDAVAAARFDDLAGMDDVIRQLREMVLLPLQYPEIFSHLGVSPPRGILFHGVPGSGKTLAARALAGECSRVSPVPVTFYARKGADCLGKFVGESERTLRLMFQEASKNAPAIIFLDEIDALVPGRAPRSGTQDQIHASVVSTLLSLMDGMADRGNVVVIAATNRPDSIDSALRRPGRFDREVYFGLPGPEQRAAILKAHTRRWDPQPGSKVMEKIAGGTEGYAGADLAALCTAAVMNAVRRVAPELIEHTEALVDGRIVGLETYTPEKEEEEEDLRKSSEVKEAAQRKSNIKDGNEQLGEPFVVGNGGKEAQNLDKTPPDAPVRYPQKSVVLPEIIVEPLDWDQALCDAPEPCSRREATHALAADLARPLAYHVAPLLLPALQQVLQSVGRSSLPLPVAVREATTAAVIARFGGCGVDAAARPTAIPSSTAAVPRSGSMLTFESSLIRLGAIQNPTPQHDTDMSTTLLGNSPECMAEAILPCSIPASTRQPTALSLSELSFLSEKILPSSPPGTNTDYVRPREKESESEAGAIGAASTWSHSTISMTHPPLRLLIAGCGESGQHEVAGAVLKLFGGSHVTVLSLPTIIAEGAGDAANGVLSLTRAALQRADPHSTLVLHVPRLETWAVVAADIVAEESDQKGMLEELGAGSKGGAEYFSSSNFPRDFPSKDGLGTSQHAIATKSIGHSHNSFSPTSQRPFSGLSTLPLRIGGPSLDFNNKESTQNYLHHDKQAAGPRNIVSTATNSISLMVESDAWITFDGLIREVAPRQPLILLATTTTPLNQLPSSILGRFEASGGVFEVNIDSQHSGGGEGTSTVTEDDEELEAAIVRVGEAARERMASYAAAAFADRVNAVVQQPERWKVSQQGEGIIQQRGIFPQEERKKNLTSATNRSNSEQQNEAAAEIPSCSGVRPPSEDVSAEEIHGTDNNRAPAAVHAALATDSQVKKLQLSLNDAEWQKGRELYSSIQKFLVDLGRMLMRDRRCKAAGAVIPAARTARTAGSDPSISTSISMYDLALAAANGHFLSLEQLQGAVTRAVALIHDAADREERKGFELLRHPHAVAFAHAVQDSIDAACHALRASIDLYDPTNARIVGVVTELAEVLAEECFAAECAARAAEAEGVEKKTQMMESSLSLDGIPVDIDNNVEETTTIQPNLLVPESGGRSNQNQDPFLVEPTSFFVGAAADSQVLVPAGQIESTNLATDQLEEGALPIEKTLAGIEVALSERDQIIILEAKSKKSTAVVVVAPSIEKNDLSSQLPHASSPSFELLQSAAKERSNRKQDDDGMVLLDEIHAEHAVLLESIRKAAAQVQQEVLQRARFKESAMDFVFSASLRDCALWRAVNEALPALLARGIRALDVALEVLSSLELCSCEDVFQAHELFVIKLLGELNKL